MAEVLSLKQRYLMDTYGYVIIPDLIEPELMARVRAAMDRMDRELPTTSNRDSVPDGESCKYIGSPTFSKVGPCIDFDPVCREIAMHPNVLGVVESLLGGPARYEEQECSINRREPGALDRPPDVTKLGWHRGIGTEFSNYVAGDGRRHYLWIKAIVFLTDIGPDDGGTSVIPGTHRFHASTGEIVSGLEPWMVHQAQGRAGSVLFFSEALIHAVTPIRSEATRYIMITGYVPPFMREYERCTPPLELLSRAGARERAFLTGDDPERGSRYGFRRS